MKTPILSGLWLLLVVLAAAGCQPREITALQRKQAASLESEAKFALNLKEVDRAEALYAKAAALCPDNAGYWLNLGVCRKRLNRTAEARKAYESALKVHKDAYAREPKNGHELLEQVYVLALLGLMDDAHKILEKAQADHGDDPRIRGFTRQSLQKLTDDAAFKGLSL